MPNIVKQQIIQRWIRRTTPIPSSVIRRSDLPKLFARLQDKVSESVEIQIAPLPCPPGMASSEWDDLKDQARNAANLTAYVTGTGGEQVVTTEENGLLDQHLPDRISSITFDAAVGLKNALNVDLTNRFVLKLDFSEPPGFGDYEPTVRPTPNDSSLEVSGPDDTWVGGVHDTVLQFFQARATSRKWLHSSNVFLAVHWFLVLPAAIWISYRLVKLLPVPLRTSHPVLTAGLYLYYFYVAFLVFRLVKLWTRRAWPFIELAGERETTARVILASLGLGLLGAIVYDALKQMF